MLLTFVQFSEPC